MHQIHFKNIAIMSSSYSIVFWLSLEYMTSFRKLEKLRIEQFEIMFQIKLFDTTRSETGKAAWLGTGAIWGNVLRSKEKILKFKIKIWTFYCLLLGEFIAKKCKISI